MKTDIYLLHYNNYFNRTVKKAGNYVADYLLEDIAYQKFDNVNFVPGDGVLTSLVLGTGREITDLELENFDYLLVANHVEENDTSDSSDEDNLVVSRWFVMNCNRTRLGQYQFSLKRDVIVDNYNAIIEAPVYIEKANISDVNNPLIFNKEGLNVNQIKEKEYPIQDETKSGWIVGYVPRDIQPGAVDSDVILPGTADITVNGLSNWEFWKNVIELNTNGKYLTEDTGIEKISMHNKSRYSRTVYSAGTTTYFSSRYGYFQTNTTLDQYNCYNPTKQSASAKGVPTTGPAWYEDWSGLEWVGNTAPSQSASTGGFSNTALQKSVANIYRNSYFIGYVKAFLNQFGKMEFGATSGLRALDQKVLLDSSTGIYYRISIKYRTGSENTYTVTTSSAVGSNIINFMNDNLVRTNLESYSYQLRGNLRSGDVTITGLGQLYYIELDQLAVSLRFTIPDHDHRSHLEDAPYDMFCIPYSDTLKLYDGTDTFTCNKSVALSMATAIAPNLGSGEVYDIQLLPYCPCREAVINSSSPDDTLDISTVSNSPIQLYTDGTLGAKYSAVIWCSRSIFDLDVPNSVISHPTNFSSPYTEIASGAVVEQNTYYMLLNFARHDEGVFTPGAGIRTDSVNKIKLYKVDKRTSSLADAGEYYNGLTIEGGESHTIADLEARRFIVYKYGNSENPEIALTLAEYNELPYYFAIYLEAPNTISALLAGSWWEYFKTPTAYYYDALIRDAEDLKLSNECDLYRLVSGNYNGIFEFSMAKSYGIDGFKVECNYKPWSPYIHVVPKLGGLYGENFINLDDARGLICGGDYSLTQLSNEWANYQMNNKTYQEMFDRQIKNLDVQQNVQMQQAEYQAIAGIFTGGASGIVAGAAAGGKVGGGYGAIAGAAIGGTAGTAGGVWGGTLDLQNLETLQKEQRSYSIDMYNYNLQNIQAIPSSITKTTALTQNTRVWPFLEYYTCTDIEKQALRDKIKYNGMTVMAIGKLADYIDPEEPHFFLGQVIKLPDIRQDSHMANDIYNEIQKGVFI